MALGYFKTYKRARAYYTLRSCVMNYQIIEAISVWINLYQRYHMYRKYLTAIFRLTEVTVIVNRPSIANEPKTKFPFLSPPPCLCASQGYEYSATVVLAQPVFGPNDPVEGFGLYVLNVVFKLLLIVKCTGQTTLAHLGLGV